MGYLQGEHVGWARPWRSSSTSKGGKEVAHESTADSKVPESRKGGTSSRELHAPAGVVSDIGDLTFRSTAETPRRSSRRPTVSREKSQAQRELWMDKKDKASLGAEPPRAQRYGVFKPILDEFMQEVKDHPVQFLEVVNSRREDLVQDNRKAAAASPSSSDSSSRSFGDRPARPTSQQGGKPNRGSPASSEETSDPLWDSVPFDDSFSDSCSDNSFLAYRVPVSSPGLPGDGSQLKPLDPPARDGWIPLPEQPGWRLNPETEGWLQEPSEHVYFHVPSSTLWRVDSERDQKDAPRGTQLRISMLSRSSSSLEGAR